MDAPGREKRERRLGVQKKGPPVPQGLPVQWGDRPGSQEHAEPNKQAQWGDRPGSQEHAESNKQALPRASQGRHTDLLRRASKPN